MNAKKIEQDFTEEDYEDFLNDCYGEVDICGMTFDAGHVLREMDPIAFDCGMADYTSELPDKWECGECGCEYDNEEEAEDCCRDDEDDEDIEEED